VYRVRSERSSDGPGFIVTSDVARRLTRSTREGVATIRGEGNAGVRPTT
jgi:hypothetical protein